MKSVHRDLFKKRKSQKDRKYDRERKDKRRTAGEDKDLVEEQRD